MPMKALRELRSGRGRKAEGVVERIIWRPAVMRMGHVAANVCAARVRAIRCVVVMQEIKLTRRTRDV